MKNSTLNIQTVTDYNNTQSSMCMVFQNNDGSMKKRGFVVTHNDENIFKKTLKEAQNITTEDFIIDTPAWMSNGCGISNVEYINQ